MFAAARIGAIALPLNARLTAREIHPLLLDSRPRLLVHDSEHLEVAREAAPEFTSRLAVGDSDSEYEQQLARLAPVPANEEFDPEDPMILMYTSGTTGTPKGALLPHRKTLYNSLNAQIFFDLNPDDRVLVALPLFHSFGLLILSLPTLFAGGTVFLHSRFEPHEVWTSVENDGIDFFGGVPVMFRSLLEALETPESHYELGGLRFLFSAGSAISVELIHQFQRYGLVLKQGFGQTETSILCCLDAKDAVEKAGSVGRPVRHAQVRVVRLDSVEGPSEEWSDTGAGETGEIVVRGPITMLGYWERPQETSQTLVGEWLRTGDLGHWDEEGFLTLAGRSTDMYISGGENVYPAEVENVLMEHPDLAEVAIRGIPDPNWGEVGKAYVVMKDDAPLDAEALMTWARERLAPFKIPRHFIVRDQLPRTVTGKIQKHRIE